MIDTHIIQISQDSSSLTSFEEKEWPIADTEHYGRYVSDWKTEQFIYGIHRKDTLLGYIKYTIEAGVMHIEQILISSDHRQKGYGSKLLAHAETHALSTDTHKMYLLTGITWASEAFYKKHGFKKIAILPNHFLHHDFVMYEKILPKHKPKS